MTAKTAPTDLIEWLDADPLMTAAEAEWWRTHAARVGDEKQLCQRDMIACECDPKSSAESCYDRPEVSR